MKLSRVTLGVVCALGCLCPLFAAEPTGPKEPVRQVLIEFVVLEIAGGNSRPALPAGEVLSNPPDTSGLSYAVRNSPDLESTLAALSRGARVKIVQRPRIQTSHGTPATLFIGEEDPNESSGLNNEPLMVGLTLAVTPIIDSNGVITMDVLMKQVSRDGKRWTKAGLVPITTTREAQTKLTLRDRETILMGGLMASAKQTSAPPLRSPKDLSGSSPIRSTPGETLLLVRPTLL